MSMIKDILITGISGDLGRILATELAKTEGVRIIGTMRRRQRSDDLFDDNVKVIDNCDLSILGSCEQLAHTISSEFKDPFAYIHSVGFFREHLSFLDYPPSDGRTMFDSHVITFHNTLYTVLPLMRRNGGGSCVAFSCSSLRYAYPWMTSFTACKGAIESMVRSLANEFGGDKIRLNALAIATLKTEKEREAKPNGDFENYVPPVDIVPIIRFLLSDDSYLINGNSINVYNFSKQFFNSGYFQRIAK